MKEYKISYFRLSLVLLGYLIYNLVYYTLDYSGGYAFFIVWPIFFLSLAMISSFDSFNILYFITFTSKEKELDRQFLSARS